MNHFHDERELGPINFCQTIQQYLMIFFPFLFFLFHFFHQISSLLGNTTAQNTPNILIMHGTADGRCYLLFVDVQGRQSSESLVWQTVLL